MVSYFMLHLFVSICTHSLYLYNFTTDRYGLIVLHSPPSIHLLLQIFRSFLSPPYKIIPHCKFVLLSVPSFTCNSVSLLHFLIFPSFLSLCILSVSAFYYFFVSSLPHSLTAPTLPSSLYIVSPPLLFPSIPFCFLFSNSFSVSSLPFIRVFLFLFWLVLLSMDVILVCLLVFSSFMITVHSSLCSSSPFDSSLSDTTNLLMFSCMQTLRYTF